MTAVLIENYMPPAGCSSHPFTPCVVSDRGQQT
jgi:hypothetical protein